MGDDYEFIEHKSETWNTAQGFSITKILKILVVLDDYERIAEFGALTIEESLPLPQEVLTERRLQAIKRMCSELLMLVGNSRFIMRKIGAEELERIRDKLKKLRNFLPQVEIKNFDQRTNRYQKAINETHFFNCLEDLRQIKEDINLPLNRAQLIFPASDEIDPDDLKKQIIEGG